MSYVEDLFSAIVQTRAWLMIACLLLECLAALWAASSRGHWFLRALVIWAAVGMLVPARAYEQVWLFAASSLLIVGMIQLGRWGKLSKTRATLATAETIIARRRFGLRDLFLLVFLVGLWLVALVPAARAFRPDVRPDDWLPLGRPSWIGWIGWIVSSAALAILAVLAFACVEGTRRRLAATLLVGAIPLFALIPKLTGDWANVWGLFGVFPNNPEFFAHLLGPTFVGAGTSLSIVVVLSLWRVARSPKHAMHLRWLSGGLLAALVVAGAGPVGYIWFYLIQTPKVSKLETPANNYRRITAIALELAELVPKNTSLSEWKLAGATTTEQASAAEALYAELFALLETRNAVEYDPQSDATVAYANRQNIFSNSLQHVGKGLMAESESAFSRRDFNSAVRCALANVRLGAMMQRGGTYPDCEVGVEFESLGFAELAKHRADWAPEQARKIIAVLHRSLLDHEDPAAVIRRTEHCHKGIMGWQIWERRIFKESRENWEKGVIQHYTENARQSAATNLLLQTDLAARLYRRDHGRWPRTLRELSPDYLPVVPIDPHSGRPLMYRGDEPSFVLYSVGWDGKDNGGVLPDYGTYEIWWYGRKAGHDFDLETSVGYYLR